MRTAALLLICVLGGTARAQIRVGEPGWQLSLEGKKQRGVYHDIAQWLFPPDPRSKQRPRAVIRLVNEGGGAQTALLLRYVFAARLRKIGREEEGIWAIPFIVEERRIPRLPARAEQAVPLYMNRVALKTYLDRMYRTGFWPDAVMVRVMLEPRPGETLAGRIVEKTLPVLWKPPSGAPGR